MQNHLNNIKEILADYNVDFEIAHNELNIIINQESQIFIVLESLKNNYSFEQMTDITAVDYLTYGQAEWKTGVTVSQQGFSRGKEAIKQNKSLKQRFEMIYQLLSFKHNIRVRVKAKLDDKPMCLVDSVSSLWPSADWAEREVFDMFGIYFKNHPDLRRVLTDYGFVGHPLRKDFPQTGYVEMRYDENQGRVVYEPVEIDDRVNTARVIRK